MNPFKFIDNKMKAKYEKLPGYTVHIRYHYLVLRIIFLLPVSVVWLLISNIEKLVEFIYGFISGFIPEPVKYVKKQ